MTPTQYFNPFLLETWNLDFSCPRIDRTSSRLRKLIFIFKNLRHVADTDTLCTMYLALCQTLLLYCLSTWGHCLVMFHLDHAQRAVFKVRWKLPCLYPTTNVSFKWQVSVQVQVSVREIFILPVFLKLTRLLNINALVLKDNAALIFTQNFRLTTALHSIVSVYLEFIYTTTLFLKFC